VTSFLYSGGFKAGESSRRALVRLAASASPAAPSTPVARELPPTPAAPGAAAEDVSSVVDRFTVLAYL